MYIKKKEKIKLKKKVIIHQTLLGIKTYLFSIKNNISEELNIKLFKIIKEKKKI